MADVLLNNGSVQIVRSVPEGHGSQLGSQHDPVGLDVGDIVQHQTRNSHGPELIQAALWAGLVFRELETTVFRQEGEGNKTGKAPALVLLLTQATEVVNPVLRAFQMAEKHAAICLDAQTVRFSGNAQPGGSIGLVGAYLPPYLFIKNFRAASRHHHQTGFLQALEACSHLQ